MIIKDPVFYVVFLSLSGKIPKKAGYIYHGNRCFSMRLFTLMSTWRSIPAKIGRDEKVPSGS